MQLKILVLITLQQGIMYVGLVMMKMQNYYVV